MVKISTAGSENSIRMPRLLNWTIFGSKVPREEIVYFCQIIVVYTVVITSIANLSLNSGQTELWISLLSSGIGYLLPNPTLTNHGQLLPYTSEQRKPSPLPKELPELFQSETTEDN